MIIDFENAINKLLITEGEKCEQNIYYRLLWLYGTSQHLLFQIENLNPMTTITACSNSYAVPYASELTDIMPWFTNAELCKASKPRIDW